MITSIKSSKLTIGYKKQKNSSSLFSDINVEAHEGELIALLGQNGIGKSTFLKTLTGFIPKLSGDTQFYNKSIELMSRQQIAKMVSFVSTENVYVPHLTVRKLIEFGRIPYTGLLGKIDEIDEIHVYEAAKSVGILNLLDKNLYEISDGEKQRAMIARMLAQDTPIMILDEPTAFLDIKNKFELVYLLSDLSRNHKKTILFSTHDLQLAQKKADLLWIMLEDKFVSGCPEDIVVQGIMQLLFNSENLNFNTSSGNFEFSTTQNNFIKVINHQSNQIGLKNLLQRLNFTASLEVNFPYIEYYNYDKIIFGTEIERFECSDFYQLSLHLKKFTKN